MKDNQIYSITCEKCGFKEEVSGKNYKRRKIKCLACGKKAKEEKIWENIVEILNSKNMIPLNRVKNKKEIINFECLLCGKVDSGTVDNIERDRKKCDCHPTKIFKTNKTTVEFIDELSDNIKRKFKVVSDYKDRNSIVKLECKQCGQIINKWALTLLNEKTARCHCENRSKGESDIFCILRNLDLSFEEQYFFNFQNTKLSFDFYLPEHQIAIEYNGIQHYQPVEHFGGEEKFKRRRLLDELKMEYCEINNIKLITIPYWRNMEWFTNELNQCLRFND